MNVWKTACGALLSLAAGLTLVGSQAQAYNPPAGPAPGQAIFEPPKAHGVVILKAIGVLHKDGYTQVANTFWSYRQQLLDGARIADKQGGDILLSAQMSLLGVDIVDEDISIPANTMAHFYNPYTGLGLQLFRGAGSYESVLEAAQFLNIGPWQVHALLGPQLAVTDLCDWYYALAVEQMRQGHTAEAMTHLGTALHLLADCSVPQHVTNRHGGYPGAKHGEFEDVCDAVLVPEDRIPHAQSAVEWGDLYAHPEQHTPGWLGHEGAMRATSLLDAATATWPDMESAARIAIPLGEQLCAILLKRFWEQWRDEPFLVTFLRIDRVRSMDGDLDYWSSADFSAQVMLHDRWHPETAYLPDENDVDPQALSPFAWTYARWVAGRPDCVAARVEVWDADCPDPDDMVDVTPIPGYALDLNYWIGTGSVTFANHEMKGPDFVSWGGPSPGDNAQMWVHIEHAPKTTTTVPELAYVSGTVAAADGTPARGSHLFFRREGYLGGQWQRVPVEESGQFSLPSIMTQGPGYVLRPAGSGYDFAGVPLVLQPVPGNNPVAFVAQPSARLALPLHAAVAPVAHRLEPRPRRLVRADPARLRDPARARTPPGSEKGPLVNAYEEMTKREIVELLGQQAVKMQAPSPGMGVVGNSLGYPEKGTFLVHVASVVDPKTGTPILDPGALTLVTKQIPLKTGQAKTVHLIEGAVCGPGAANVRLRAVLWLGNPSVGYRRAAEASNLTDAEGSCAFVMRSGTHVEEVKFSVEVDENPVNPWCTPKKESLDDQRRLVYASAHLDDTVLPQTYQLNPVLTASLREALNRPRAVLAANDVARARGARDPASALAAEQIDLSDALARFKAKVDSDRLRYDPTRQMELVRQRPRVRLPGPVRRLPPGR